MCLNQLSPVQKSQHRLTAVVAMFEAEKPVREIATLSGVSESTLYRWRVRVLDALMDDCPGPNPARVEQLDTVAEPPPTPAQSLCSISDRKVRALILQMHGGGMTDRGIVQHFALLFDRPSPISLGTIGTFIKHAGRIARTLLITLPSLQLHRVKAVAIDDIYLHGKGTKVTLEPCSGVVLDVRRLHERDAEEWQLILSQFPHIRLLIGDGAKEFDATAEGRKLWRQLDWMHERQWWTRQVFTPLSRSEGSLNKAVARAENQQLDAATIAVLKERRAAYETAFYLAVQIEEKITTLFRPLGPDGCVWTMDTAYEVGAQALDLLSKKQSEPAIETRLNQASKHFESGFSGYIAFHRMWDDVEITFRAGVEWTRAGVFENLIQERELRRKMHDPQSTTYEQWLCKTQANRLQNELSQRVTNADDVRRTVDELLKRPLRSSSLVEAFNARIRVIQTARRNVSDELLALAALQWNVNTREDGPRRDSSPYKLLGVLAMSDEREWWDILLDEMEAMEKQPKG